MRSVPMRSHFFSKEPDATSGTARERRLEPGLGSGAATRESTPAVDHLRRRIFRELFEQIEQDGARSLTDPAELHGCVDDLMEEARKADNINLSALQWQQVRRQVLDEIQGLGPLAPLLANPDISDILVNGPDEVWVDKAGRLERTDVRFDDERHLRRLLERMVAACGRHVDASSPYVDATLDDGSRLHAVVPPLSVRGAIISIRRFRARRFEEKELLAQGFFSGQVLELLRLAVQGRCNIVIAGGASAGKTSLLNFLSRYIPKDERVVTLEETAELRLEHPHVISLETRAPNIEGRGGIGLRELLKTALRMRADRIIVGEVRGDETLDMLQAMNVGHDGSFTTVHASSVSDVIHRLEALALMGGTSIPREVVRSMVASAIDLIVYVMRFRDGRRVLTAIHEVYRTNDEVHTREIVRFRPGNPVRAGASVGEHVLVQRPLFLQALAARGYTSPEHLLTPARQGEVS